MTLTAVASRHAPVIVGGMILVGGVIFLITHFTGGSESSPAPAGNTTNLVSEGALSYFGCGCFWHVQHAMVTGAETPLLGRSGADLTAFTGYAGGSGSDAGRVCYHNWQLAEDYGSLGYAEVVSVDLPEANLNAVAENFFESICVRGVRQDRQDAGAEYRSLVGFPGGIDSVMGRAFKDIGEGYGVNVVAGVGGDADTLGTVYVMDSIEFPFYQAEVYHQFHDDMTAAYGADYNSLRDSLLSDGVLQHTGCPRDSAEALATV